MGKGETHKINWREKRKEEKSEKIRGWGEERKRVSPSGDPVPVTQEVPYHFQEAALFFAYCPGVRT